MPVNESLPGEYSDPSGCLICEFVIPAQTQIDEIDNHTLGLMLRDFEAGEGMVKLPCPIEKVLIRIEEPCEHSAAHLTAALQLFMSHHYPAYVQVQFWPRHKIPFFAPG